MPTDLWGPVDYPVLVAIADAAEQPGERFYLDWRSVVEGLGLSEESAIRSILRLTDDGFISSQNRRQGNGDWSLMIQGPTAKGLRAVGSWPSREFAVALESALEELEHLEQDQDRRRRVAELRRAVVAAGRDLLVDVVAATADYQLARRGI